MPDKLNPKTLVTVHGYAGDRHQIKNMLRYYEHHGCPVVIFSPEDSPIHAMGPHICRVGGKRAYIGPLSLERQRIHLQMMLEYKEFDWFLCNDSDSVCVASKIPTKLFQERVLWSNEVSDEMHVRKPDYTWPRLAFQPPYLMPREVVQALVDIAPTVAVDSQTPFIDWCMMSWAIAGNIPHKNFPNGISCPTSDEHCLGVMVHHVERQGKIMCHSIKTARALTRVLNARMKFNRLNHGKNRL